MDGGRRGHRHAAGLGRVTARHASPATPTSARTSNFIGIDSPGALQTLWNVPAETLVRLPADLALDVAALVEPVAVAVHDVRRSELSVGDKAVVIGGGPIGVLIATVAREYGADVLRHRA